MNYLGRLVHLSGGGGLDPSAAPATARRTLGMNKNTLRVIGTAVVGLLIMAGCGVGAGSPAGTGETAAAPPAPTPAPTDATISDAGATANADTDRYDRVGSLLVGSLRLRHRLSADVGSRGCDARLVTRSRSGAKREPRCRPLRRRPRRGSDRCHGVLGRRPRGHVERRTGSPRTSRRIAAPAAPPPIRGRR